MVLFYGLLHQNIEYWLKFMRTFWRSLKNVTFYETKNELLTTEENNYLFSVCMHKKYTPRFNRVVTMMMTCYHQPLLSEMDCCTLLLNCGRKLTLQRLQRHSAALELQLVVISLPVALSYTWLVICCQERTSNARLKRLNISPSGMKL